MTDFSDINALNAAANGLVFDRTQDDVDHALACERNNIYPGHDLKGAYNISDLNRVGEAINNIAGFFRNTCKHDTQIKVKENRNIYDIVTTAENQAVVFALSYFRYLLPYDKTPQVPADLDSLTYIKANAAERILFDLCGVIARLLDGIYCGDGFLGTDYY